MPSRLADLTTIRLGGPAARIVTARTTPELVQAVTQADRAGEPVLLVGGGSNLVVSDDGWPGVVILIRTRGIGWSAHDGTVTVAAGEPWDAFASTTVEQGWSGLETLVGIPGLTGATPVQNVGAYGSEIADVLVSLTVLDRDAGSITSWGPERCGFGFRSSVFKHTDRYVILDVTLRLRPSRLSIPIRYQELARRLGVEPGEQAPTDAVRNAVSALRRSKGMLLDEDDHDTWSVGSFFVNPFLPPELVPPSCPHWSTGGGTKLSAAWLIENAGFGRGYRLDAARSSVAVSTKHSLALTNRGDGATTDQLLALAGAIQRGVFARYAVWLAPEPRLAGVTLPQGP